MAHGRFGATIRASFDLKHGKPHVMFIEFEETNDPETAYCEVSAQEG